MKNKVVMAFFEVSHRAALQHVHTVISRKSIDTIRDDMNDSVNQRLGSETQGFAKTWEGDSNTITLNDILLGRTRYTYKISLDNGQSYTGLIDPFNKTAMLDEALAVIEKSTNAGTILK